MAQRDREGGEEGSRDRKKERGREGELSQSDHSSLLMMPLKSPGEMWEGSQRGR